VPVRKTDKILFVGVDTLMSQEEPDREVKVSARVRRNMPKKFFGIFSRALAETEIRGLGKVFRTGNGCE
jgi:hypothetical protein